MLNGVNLWAVLAATLSSLLLGGLWYSKKVFGGIWLRENGPCKHDQHRAVIFGLAIVLWFIAAFTFAWFLGPYPDFNFAVFAGLATGLCWVATSFGINYLFAGKSLILFLIDAGYHAVQFLLYGVIIGLWH